MRKNRNSFFAESNMNFQGYNPMVANAPYQATSANNMFYSGQIPMTNYHDDISERLAKIERQINRLEHKVNNLESNHLKTTDDYDSSVNNMYMI